MKTTRSAAMLEALKRSLDSANAQEPETRTKGQAPSESPKLCRRLSISLFPSDMERIEELREALASSGIRVSVSDAVKLALRTCSTDAARLASEIESIRLEDGRRS